MALVPCGHMCLCLACCTRLRAAETSRCPICRARIEGGIHVHDAGVPGDLPPPPSAHVSIARAVSVVVAAGPAEAGPRPIAISVTSSSGSDAVTVVRISSPEDAKTRLGADIVIAIDVSGSMGEDATYEDATGNVRTDGLSVLDIARHGIRVVAALLKDGDRLGVVTFNSAAHVVLPLTCMNDAGRVATGAAVDAMRANGGTNIWGGLEAAMDLLREGSSDAALAGREQSVLLLTDGVPNVEPPTIGGVQLRNQAAAHVAAFVSYSSAHPDFHCTVRTFGFGYRLDSELLVAVSRVGGGTFAFIPVAPVMGTTFVHAIANTLTTRSSSCTLNISAAGGAVIGGATLQAAGPLAGTHAPAAMTASGPGIILPGRVSAFEENWGLVVNAGPLQSGQSRDILVPYSLSTTMGVAQADAPRILVTADAGGQRLTARADLTASDASAADATAIEIARLRCAVADAIHTMVSVAESGGAAGLASAHATLASLVQQISASPLADDEGPVAAILNDLVPRAGTLHGRVLKALDGEARFKRWGRHFLRALGRAHEIQQCTNQQDFGLQSYGSALFAALRTRGAALFLALPPPSAPPGECPYCGLAMLRSVLEAHVARCSGDEVGPPHPAPHHRGGAGHGGGSGARSSRAASPPPPAAPAPEVSNNYTIEGGGCFGAATMVSVSRSGSLESVPIHSVVKGDRIVVEGGGTGTVTCVVRYFLPPGSGVVSIPGGPLLTAHHPVRCNGVWRAPVGLGPIVAAGKQVYNLVLDSAPHVIIADGWPCVTMGHGITDPGAVHAFYGTQRCVDALRPLPGFSDGLVEILGTVRDSEGRSTGFLPLDAGLSVIPPEQIEALSVTPSLISVR